jgi:protein involved in polysaccharide export with SLBB domain
MTKVRSALGLLTLALCLMVVGCGGQEQVVTAAATGATGEGLSDAQYRLASGDRVKITVFRHDDLSGEFALDGAGNLAMPLVGEIQANGRTPRELERQIETQLADGYIVEPRVAIEVLTYRPYYILGEVARPGRYEYVSGMNVLNAVAIAGGFSYRARQNNFIIQRGGANAPQIAADGSAPVLPGDVITVRERFF